MRRPTSVRGLLWATLLSPCFLSGPALGQPPAPRARSPQVWTITVGIDNYANGAIPDSRTAARNAQRVQRWIRRMGWDQRHQLLLSDFGTTDPGEVAAPSENILPTRRNLDWAFRRWLEANARAGDVVVIYFAGESRTVSRPQGAGLDVQSYLLPRDANPLDIEQTGWSLERAVDLCVRHKLRVVCWLATAPTEAPTAAAAVPPAAATRPAAAARPAAGGSPGIAWLARLARWPGVTAWLASDRPRGASAGRSADPGTVFTDALLEALGASGPGQPGIRRPNLATSLKDLQEDARLKLQGFCSLGGVPPSMTLWPGDLGKDAADPRPQLVIQAGHADRVTAMAFPADGRLIVTAAMDSTIRIWSAPDRSLLRVLPGQAVGVTAMAMTRDGRWLISGGGRGAVQVFDRQNDFKPVRLAAPQPHFKRVAQIALLPDDVHFVSVDADGQSVLWELGGAALTRRPWLDARCQEVVCGGRVGPGGQDTGFVAARCDDGKVRVFNSAGAGEAVRPLTRPSPVTMAVSTDGGLLAVGYEDGLVVVHDLKTGGHRDYAAAETRTAVHRLVFSSGGLLAIGHKDGVRLVGPSPDPAIAPPGATDARRAYDLMDRPPQDLVFSPGGDYLAACSQEVGAVRVWRIAGDGAPTEVLNDPQAQASVLGITGNGRGLAIADVSGGLEFRPLDPQGDEAPWAFPAHRGKLQQLSASPDRQLVLFLDEQRGARIWDLKERTCRRLPGTYRAGAFIDDNRIVLIPDSNMGDHAGRLILADRSGKWAAAPFFADKADGFKRPDGIPFERVAVTPDGGRVAAASDSGKDPLVCVWETKKGLLTHWITTERLEDPVLALAFSSDGRYLLTGGDAPAARLWDLPARQGALAAPAVTFEDKSITANITCVAIRPGAAGRVVTGHSNGQVHAWKWEAGQPGGVLDGPRLVAGEFATAVKALCFTSDGRYLAASGDGKRIWLGAMDPQPRSIDALARLAPHHDEQINALCTWRDRPILISGSDDTTIRFWDIEAKVLRGTFSAGSRPAVPGAAAVQELDWVLYTPEGYYDASAQATRLVHYRRPAPSRAAGARDRGRDSGFLSVGVRAVEESGQLDQLAAKLNIFGLGEQLLRGVAPGQEPASEGAPPITISVAPPSNPAAAEALLNIKMAADDFEEVRLYHNDVPIPSGWDPARKPGPGADPPSLDVAVKLVSGLNRFYAMASRQDDYDSCSRVVEVNYESPAERGQVHVVALGVKDYEARRLRYSEDDAEQLSEFIHDRGLDAAGRQGIRRVLLGNEVSRENVERVFDEIARRVEDRPQDTVVVFLAGHTDVFAPQRFCLLLPTYPFGKMDLKPVPEAPILVAARGAPLAEENKKVDPRFVLPYSVIEANLSRLKALNRLVIVDACQAEAIYVDPKVRAIRKWMELSSRKGRTKYLLGARRGELALEASSLAHGLLTYALLRGMQARLPQEPAEVKALALPADADYNRDGIVSTDELDAYSKQVLPQLAGIFPQLTTTGRGQAGGIAARDGGAGKVANPAVNPADDQALKVQGSEAGFPLVELRNAPGPP